MFAVHVLCKNWNLNWSRCEGWGKHCSKNLKLVPVLSQIPQNVVQDNNEQDFPFCKSNIKCVKQFQWKLFINLMSFHSFPGKMRKTPGWGCSHVRIFSSLAFVGLSCVITTPITLGCALQLLKWGKGWGEGFCGHLTWQMGRGGLVTSLFHSAEAFCPCWHTSKLWSGSEAFAVYEYIEHFTGVSC